MNDTPFELIRSKRKTLALVVDSEGKLIVRAPLRMSDEVISGFLQQKAHWIAEKQRQMKDEAAQRTVFSLEEGQSILYLGRAYTIRRRPVGEVSVDGDALLVPDDMTPEDFSRWMQAQGDGLIRERVEHYAIVLGVAYRSVKLSGARGRWGSCGGKNTLNFAWRLVMCPPWVIDYVVVHELAHITHKNHGAKFWAQVAAVLPHYKEAQRWLRLNRTLMEVL